MAWLKTLFGSKFNNGLHHHTKAYSKINVIGSGGNINSIYRFSEKKVGQPLSYLFMSNFYEKVKKYDYNQRVFELKMNPDRADVIIPATRIYSICHEVG